MITLSYLQQATRNIVDVDAKKLNPMKNSLQPGKSEFSCFALLLVDAWEVSVIGAGYLNPN